MNDVQVSFQKIMLFLHLMPEKRSSIEANRNVARHFEKITHFEKNIQIFFSKCVKFGTNLTHFENFFQSALRVYINITFGVNF